MDMASQTEAVLQKKDLFSSSVSTNSVDIDNPVPQEGRWPRKGQRGNQKIPAFDATLCRPAAGCYSRAGQGQVPVTLSMPCHCGGTGTTEWGRFSSHRWRVEY
jgi:hypothetical protein